VRVGSGGRRSWYCENGAGSVDGGSGHAFGARSDSVIPEIMLPLSLSLRGAGRGEGAATIVGVGGITCGTGTHASWASARRPVGDPI
jgi:hypothetical protein